MEYKEVILNKKCKNWVEAIREAAIPLLNKKLISKKYIDTMIEYNEKYNAYFVIAESIALIHARPEDGVIKNCVSLMTLKEPINFGNEENDPVKMIICLASIDSVSHLEFLKKIMRIIENREFYEEIITSSDEKYIVNKFL